MFHKIACTTLPEIFKPLISLYRTYWLKAAQLHRQPHPRGDKDAHNSIPPLEEGGSLDPTNDFPLVMLSSQRRFIAYINIFGCL
ncbi:MAG: hypothetical protein KAV87_21910 [Desulfobacteraceae bacterium]|nr:hypothetical protein [Desulfobacteraceae bacterium]